MKLLSICASIVLLCFTVPAISQVEVDFPKKGKRELSEIREGENINLSGLWEGEITQLLWDGQPEFKGVSGKMHVEIYQEKDRVTGLIVCRAKFEEGKGYLSYDKHFEGRWINDQLVYEDVRVENYINTHRELRHLETCLKKATLDFYKTLGLWHLEGSWEGQGHVTDVACIPGKIHLTKVNEEDLAIEYAHTVNTNFEQKNGKPVELKWDEDKLKGIKNRKVNEGNTVEVKSKTLSITVYDHKRSDGDIISLNFNGNWLLEKYKINNEQHKIDVVLDGGKKYPDYVLLYAHNLGKYPPNTVAIIIDDGVSQQRVILNSDMHVCDVIYFKFKPEN